MVEAAEKGVADAAIPARVGRGELVGEALELDAAAGDRLANDAL